MPTPRLVVATTCSDRKASIAKRRVHLREVPRDLSGRERARRWAARLKKAEGGRDSADVLYQGDHWVTSKNTFDAAVEAGFRAELWVISAGYGLYPAEAPVAAYAATFTPGHEDSVAPDRLNRSTRAEYLTAWWHAVAQHMPVLGARARTFADLARQDRSVRVLVVSGQSYLDAITDDLLEAASIVRSTDQLVVVSTGANGRRHHPLAAHLLPVDARFQHEVGGTRSALNARIAAWLMEGVLDARGFGFDYCRRKVERAAARLPEAPTYNRTPMTDAQVKRWIRTNKRQMDRPSATAMLRLFRDSGLACEQKRFGALYRSVVS